MQKFTRKKLKNGMTVLFEKRDLPLVSLCIANPFGGAFEESKIKGIAHFIEHLVFTGTKTRTHEDISREIEKKGGILNAFTANEVTSFWFKMPSEHVMAGLEILTDMLNNAVMKEEKFEKEKKVIIEEIKMYHDDPARNVYDKIESGLYENPFGENIIGSAKSINALKRDFVFKFFKDNYNPENFVVVVVGNVDIDKVYAFLEKNFRGNGKKSKLVEIKKKYNEDIEERVGIDQAHFVIGMHAPRIGSQGHAALEVLNAYLADGMSSKLFLKIREEKGLAYNVRGGISAEKSYSYYTIYAGTRKDVIDEVKKEIIDGFKNIDKMNEKELEEAKQRVIGLKKVSSEESASVMNELLFAELAGKAEDYYTYEEKIRSVKIGDVKKLAKELIKNYSIAAIVPK